MGAASFVMVLIGCAQGQACEPVMTLPVAYQNKASCLADRSDMVAASSELGYDRLFAECREQSRSTSPRPAVDAKPTLGRDLAVHSAA